MKREDVLKVDELKDELSGAFRQFEQRLRTVFGELVYAVDTVIDRYNAVETELGAVRQAQGEQARQLATVSERLLALERAFGNREH